MRESTYDLKCDAKLELPLLDYIVFLGLMAVSVAIGIYYSWIGRKDDKEGYLLGGRSLGVIPVTMSLLATFGSPVTFVGLPAEVFDRGSYVWVGVFALIVPVVVAAEIFVPVFYRLKINSVNTYITRRFKSNTLTVIVSFLTCISLFPYLGLVLYSPTLALHVATGMRIVPSILVTGAIVTAYTAFGGLKAVIWTDVFQISLMLIGLLVAIIKGTVDVGGFSEVVRRAKDGGRIGIANFDANPYMPDNVWVIISGAILIWCGSFSVSQMLIQRTSSLPTITKAKRVVYRMLPFMQIFMLLLVYFGLLIFAYYYKCDPLLAKAISTRDAMVPRFVLEIAVSKFPGFSGLYVASIFGASLSTVSSGLNSMSALVWEDYLTKYFPNASTKAEVFYTKLIAVVLGSITIGAAMLCSYFGTIFLASVAFSGTPIGPLFGLFLVGLFCPFVDVFGATAGFICGQIVSCILLVGHGLNIDRYQTPSLLSSTDECPTTTCAGVNISEGVAFSELATTRLRLVNSPTGLHYFFQLTLYLLPVVGFVVTVTVSIIVSCLIVKRPKELPDASLLSDLAARFYYGTNKKLHTEGDGEAYELHER